MPGVIKEWISSGVTGRGQERERQGVAVSLRVVLPPGSVVLPPNEGAEMVKQPQPATDPPTRTKSLSVTIPVFTAVNTAESAISGRNGSIKSNASAGLPYRGW